MPPRPSAAHWVILTGEYPGQPGGVSDYCAVLARALGETGDRVEVWASASAAETISSPKVGVHRLPDHFGWRGLRVLSRASAGWPEGTRVLVQYVPHVFGAKGMNVAFVFWLWRQRRRSAIWVMFHEVAYPLIPHQPIRHRVLAQVQRAMARVLVRAAARVFVSIPAWRDFLIGIGAPATEGVWLPIPSNLPTAVDAPQVAAFRRELAIGAGHLLVGHFGTYGPLITPLLEGVVAQVLAHDPAAIVLLLGKGSDDFAAELRGRYPAWAQRVQGSGRMEADAVAGRIAACDLMVQPYADGISSRRTTAMAALALGVPIVSNAGHLSESIWRESGCVALADRPEAEAFGPLLQAVLSDAGLRGELGKRGKQVYAEHFSIERTVEILNKPAGHGAEAFKG